VSDRTPAQRTAALEQRLEAHGHVASEDIDATVAAAESASGDRPSPALGARVVARAWADARFKARLLADPVVTLAEFSPQNVPIAVLEDTPLVHHVIVCTLCSCYPIALLGNPPTWYKSFEYRSRVVREPRAVLAEFGMEVGPDVELRVHDSTAEQRYLVLPLRPGGTDGWDEARLSTLVTRNSMIGTGRPQSPSPGSDQMRGSGSKRPTGPTTLAIDIGGTGLKAAVLDSGGRKIVRRVRTKTPYPCPPRVLVRALDELTHRLPPWDRVSVGFPGFVRAGRVLTAPNLSTKAGPGTAMSRKLVKAWAGFPLAAELEARLRKPTRLSNDADMHGLAVIRGEGLELVITLGTGLGTAVFLDGSPTPHLELALMPFRGRGTFQDELGNRERRRIGNRRWSKRVRAAVEMFDAVLHIDRLYVGGGNARRLTLDLGHRVKLVDNAAGILGGIKLWELDEPSRVG
jgi:polyphosphate glucokinase